MILASRMVPTVISLVLRLFVESLPEEEDADLFDELDFFDEFDDVDSCDGVGDPFDRGTAPLYVERKNL